MQRIELALAQLFKCHRIVFWYDVKKQMRDLYEAFGLPEIEKIELADNAFSVRCRILRQEPDRKFLLYHDEGLAPARARFAGSNESIFQNKLETCQSVVLPLSSGQR